MCLQHVIQKLPEDNLIDLSVVIPTYNRCDSLRKTLQSLQDQTLDSTRFEVVISDDGSQDQTSDFASASYPFYIQYHRQQNQGSAMARNLGAKFSQGEVLVYLDDDICVESKYLESVLRAHHKFDRAIIQGSLITVLPADPTPFQIIQAEISDTSTLPGGQSQKLTYQDCLSGFFTIQRPHYYEISEMQDVGGMDIPPGAISIGVSDVRVPVLKSC